jgi:alginate O-acetyltransferase complex protein AlgI
MLIASRAFLLLFFPISLIIYWLIARSPRQKLIVLLVLSLLFYAIAGKTFIFLLLFLSLATYWLAQRKKYFLSIIINLITLGIFKYWGFGIDNLNRISSFIGFHSTIPLLDIALPLGISFYIFKHISYLLDVRSNRIPASKNIITFVTYSAFFPQITAGPISNYADSARQFDNLPARLDLDQIYSGLLHISSGLAKKVLIADILKKSLDLGFYSDISTGSGFSWAWLSVLMFCFEIYFDFSGYTDFVIGISQLFGISLPKNFDNPYLATNINQFWQRWHISLSSWFRLYIYFPLSRGLIARFSNKYRILPQVIANLITMSLIGLWHGASWIFILWGFYHGVLLSIKAIANRGRIKIDYKILGQGLTFISIIFGWAIFMSKNLTNAVSLFANLFGIHGLGDVNVVLLTYDKYSITTLIIAIFITITGYVEAKNIPRLSSYLYTFLWGIIFLLCLLQLGSKTEFMYMLF